MAIALENKILKSCYENWKIAEKYGLIYENLIPKKIRKYKIQLVFNWIKRSCSNQLDKYLVKY
ncbi:MAG: hypothetical protein DRJ47_07225 [Thermoprotei archaeon]|nr:MAG: hypothetical protein DRJ47_07225 [Thermoprotei archaeon]